MGFRVTLLDPVAVAEAIRRQRVLADDRSCSLSSRGSAVRRRRQPGPMGRGGGRHAPSRVRPPTSGWWPRRPAPSRCAPGLSGEGIAPERIENLRAPAGMDIGATTPEEVAVSILAELIAVRRGRASFATPPLRGDGRRSAIGGADGAPRPGVRHDRRARLDPPHRRARRHDLRLLLGGLPYGLPQGPGAYLADR